MTTYTEIHVFEKAKLGVAPFYCVGMVEIPSASLAAYNVDAYNNAMAMLPKGIGVGSCAFCGMALKYNFIVKDANDRRFVVGCECVTRTGDTTLTKTVKAERKRVAQEKKEARRNTKRAELEARWKAEREARAADFVVIHARLIERAAPFIADGGFIADVIEGGQAGRYVSEKAIDTVTRVIANLEQRAAWKAASRHTGIVGKSTAFCPDQGARLTIKATVKEHSSYDGEQQTIVQRIKVV